MDSAELVKGSKLVDGNGRTLAQLPGKRLAVANELPAGQVWNDQLLKRLASGDEMSAKDLYQSSFSYRPTAKLLVMTNHLPGAHDSSDGFWRRVALLKFGKQFKEAERIPNLDAQLINAELNGILMWAIAGCRQWQALGLRVPLSIKQATTDYREDTDLLGMWLAESCVTAQNCKSGAAELFSSWSLWCSKQNVHAGSMVGFGRTLAARGFSRQKSNGCTVWLGVQPKVKPVGAP